ncbi:LysM peptidoglycan-binding domain-containing protein [Micromonospora aurantiaca (nom. illeg.)]|uniref:LysM peptidoglycan-binding domain-containing protein n=1 Tax=Micromonospora aurantiaca (nom. illeg.) TaxID=47850 RepID=UPI0033EFB49D
MRGPARSAGQVLSGVAALAVLVGLLAGIPAALVLLAGVPDRLPTLAEIGRAMIEPDESGRLFIGVVTAIGWLAWLTFAVSVTREIRAQARGRMARPLPILGPQQRLAATLVAAVALLVTGPALSATAALTPAAAAPPITTATGHAPTPSPTTAASEAPSQPATAGGQYRVAKGDYLGGIADRYLGDFDSYPTLAKLNDLASPDRIVTGQVLRLPGDAVDDGARPHATGRVVAGAVPAEKPSPNKPATEDHGQVDDDGAAERPSQPVTPPAAEGGAPPAPPAPATAGPPTQAPAPAAPPAATQPAAPQTHESAPASSDRNTDTERVDSDVTEKTALTATIGLLAVLLLAALYAQRRRQQQHRRPGRRIPQRRSSGENRLRVAAAPTDVSRLDHGLRLLADHIADWDVDDLPDVVGVWLDSSQIHLILAGECPNEPPPPFVAEGPNSWVLPSAVDLPDHEGSLAPLPALCTVGSADAGQHLLLDLERTGMLTITGDPHRSLDLIRYIAAELAHNVWSDDVRVTLAGFDPDQAQMLADLNPERITVAAAAPAAIAQVRRRVAELRAALDHAGATDTVHGRVTDNGADAWMPHVLIVAQPDRADAAALTELEMELTAGPRCGYAVVTTGGPEAPYGRWPLVVTADGDMQAPFLGDASFSAAQLPATLLEPLADLMRTAHLAGDEPTPPAPDSEAWAAGTDAAGGLLDETAGAASDAEHDDGRAATPIHLTVMPASASTSSRDEPDTAAAAPVLINLRRSDRPAEDRRRDRERRDPHLDADVAAWAADVTRPRIGILGPVQIEAPGQVPANRSRFWGEVIVYLAARGTRGATGPQLTEAIWPEQQIDTATRRAAISNARKWLGDTSNGEKWLPEMGADQRYRLADGVLLDYTLFRRLRARGEARAADGVDDLRQALRLVRGAPLEGAQEMYSPSRAPYAWLDESDIVPYNMTAAVVDTAHQMVDLRLAELDRAGVGPDRIRSVLDDARWAVEQAWLADPHRAEDQPWRDALRIAHAGGRDAELKALIHDLMRHRDADIAEDLDPDTYQLVLQLLPRLRAS